jgi:phage baseplate assembly protein W
MPYKNIIISPNNLSNQASVQHSQFYRGFTTSNETSLSNKLFDFDLILQDIINNFQTRKGERVMNPEFGTIIWDMIYEPFTISAKQEISDDITRILNSDPRVIPTQIEINEAEYGLILFATLYSKTEDISREMKLGFNKDLGLMRAQ